MINERKTVNQNKEQQEYVFSILTYRSAAKSSNQVSGDFNQCFIIPSICNTTKYKKLQQTFLL